MRRRSSLIFVLPLAALSLIGAGCGGGGSKSESTTGGSTASSSDPAAILGSVQAADQTEPTKIAMTLGIQLDGAINNPQVAAIVGNGPITISLSGPVDPTAKSADLTFDVKAGKIALPGKARIINGTEGYVGLADKWYELPAGSLTSGSGPSAAAADPAKTLEALGNPADLVQNAKVVGGEVIEGIDTDHISGEINVEGVAQALSRIAKSQDSSSGSVDQASIDKLKEALKSGTVDVWVGKADKQVHRLKFDLGIAIPPDAQSTAMGVTGAQINFTVQSTPVGSVSVSAPSGALPSDRLQQDLVTVVLSNLGSGSGTP